jgi:DNA-binding MarR family transcriptional regulator
MADDRPRWLSGDEQAAWRAFLDAVRLLIDSLDAQLQADAGMSLADYEVLAQLSESPGRERRMSGLADSVFLSRSRLSHAVARLEGAGWVERRKCPSDRRGTYCRLTDAGFAALEAAAPGHVEAVRRYVFDAFGCDEVTHLARLSEAIRSRLTS